jgi:hypothetical protein
MVRGRFHCCRCFRPYVIADELAVDVVQVELEGNGAEVEIFRLSLGGVVVGSDLPELDLGSIRHWDRLQNFLRRQLLSINRVLDGLTGSLQTFGSQSLLLLLDSRLLALDQSLRVLCDARVGVDHDLGPLERLRHQVDPELCLLTQELLRLRVTARHKELGEVVVLIAFTAVDHVLDNRVGDHKMEAVLNVLITLQDTPLDWGFNKRGNENTINIEKVPISLLIVLILPMSNFSGPARTLARPP